MGSFKAFLYSVNKSCFLGQSFQTILDQRIRDLFHHPKQFKNIGCFFVSKIFRRDSRYRKVKICLFKGHTHARDVITDVVDTS